VSNLLAHAGMSDSPYGDRWLLMMVVSVGILIAVWLLALLYGAMKILQEAAKKKRSQSSEALKKDEDLM
jgi:hypothetical protein